MGKEQLWEGAGGPSESNTNLCSGSEMAWILRKWLNDLAPFVGCSKIRWSLRLRQWLSCKLNIWTGSRVNLATILSWCLAFHARDLCEQGFAPQCVVASNNLTEKRQDISYLRQECSCNLKFISNSLRGKGHSFLHKGLQKWHWHPCLNHLT